MHLHNGEQLSFGGVAASHVDAKEERSNSVKNDRNTNDEVLQDEVTIPTGAEPSRDNILEVLVAGWILLIYRYQRDAFHHFTWGFEGAADAGVQSIAASDLGLENLETVSNVLDAVRRVKSRHISLEDSSNPVIVFNDGTKDEWTFQASIQIQSQQLRASPRWRLPIMSRHQALLQLRSYSHIISTILRNSQERTSGILNISSSEVEEVWKWNHPLQSALETCMHDIIADQAQLQPDKLAIESWDGTLSYAQVDRYSTELAQNLLLLDEKTPIVPLLFEKSRWTCVSVLAIMKAGKCFALLDPAQPEGRLRSIVEQVNASLFIASKSQAALAARVAPAATVIPISEHKFENVYGPFAGQQPKTSLPSVSPSAPLYVQFTSGSTGMPKGCLISHTQYTSGAIPRAYDVGYRSHSRVLDFASYAFDVCIDSMLCTLAHGGTLCTPSDEQRMNGLSDAMRDMKVTLAGMTPSVARTLDIDILDQLESIALGGEGVSASDAASWGKKTKVVNAYGPSECTVGATINDDVGAKPYITMGKGKGCATWLTDPSDHNKLVPIGAVGELLIEGPIVGIGYLNNPEKTKEVFIEDPEFLAAGSSTAPGRRGRLYKTGDLVRYDPDGHGEVIFVGRQDQQVKLRGQRVELSEIEYNMQKHLPADTLLAAEVIKPNGGSGDAVLVAFLVEQRQSGMRHLDGNMFASFSTKFQTRLGEMLQHLSSDLPGYMVPTAYIPLWKMPLLVSCKTDRKRLREIGTTVTRQDLRRFSAALSEKVEPTTDMELALRPLWAQVLGGESDFGANDNFFSMGGDSLRAMRLVAAAREKNLVLSVPDIMLNPALAAMAKRMKPMDDASNNDVDAFSLISQDWETDDARAEVAPLCGIEADKVEDIYPCTPLQEGLMALSAKFADAYVAQRVVELPTAVAEDLGRAFHKAITDSPILRTRIVNVPGRGLFQVVVKDGHSEHSGDNVQDYLVHDRECPMDLGKALFRYATITSPGSDKGYIVTTMHHAVYDGWSMPLIVERVNRAYAGQDTPRATSFKHFIRYLSGLDRSNSEAYWRERLQGVNSLQFPPLPYKGYTMRADSLLEHYVNVPTSAHSQTTLATIIRGAWALISSLYMGHSDIVFGETLTGRSAAVPGIEQIEGPMITTIPVRVKLNYKQPVAQYLHQIHASTVQQIEHEHLGLQNIRRLSREAREACELKTGLVLHPREDENWSDNHAPEKTPANAFVPANDEEAAREALKFNTYALMLVCTLDAHGFLIMASFDSKCVSVPIMNRLLAVLDRIVTKFCGNPEHLLGDVAVLDEDERRDTEEFRPKGSDVETSLGPERPMESEPLEETPLLSPKEEQLRILLSRILNIPAADIQPSDSFFELGGDSVGAMRLVSEARAQGFDLSVAQVFQSQSLAALAASAGSAKEEKLRGLLSRILALPEGEIGSNDSFFELGGDSIGAMRLVSEARALGINISVAQVFQSRSLSSLADVAEEDSSPAKPHSTTSVPFATLKSSNIDITPDVIQPLLENAEWKIEDVYPTRPLQQLAVEGTVDLPRYSMRYELISFSNELDETNLKSSCQALVDSNEILRTVFVNHAGLALGVVLESLPVSYEQITVPEGIDIKASARKFIDADIEAPKPHGSSFVSFARFAGSQNESILVFRISHAQYDEICLPILYQQLAALYSGSATVQTEPFSIHVNHVVTSNIPASIPYWKNLLAGSSMSVYRPNLPRTNQKPMDVYREFDISPRPAGITIGSLPTAAWAIVLATRLSTRDVVFGEVVTGRNIGAPKADRIFGPTWQYIPFRVPFNSSWTHLDLLKFVQQQHVESASYEGMGLAEIVSECTDWDPQQNTWFDSVVHQAPEMVESMEFGGLEAKFETVYPHYEPLREWKCQAFVKDGGRKLGIEIVTYEEWGSIAEGVLQEVGEVLERLVRKVDDLVFPEGAHASQAVINGIASSMK